MLTALFTISGVSLTETPPLDRDPPGQRPPGQRPFRAETPLDREPPGQRLPPPLDREPPGKRPPADRQTPVKTLPSQTSFAGGNNGTIEIKRAKKERNGSDRTNSEQTISIPISCSQ